MAKYMKTEQGYIDIPNFALEPFKPAGKSYLTFSSSSSFTLKVNNSTKNWDGTLEYFASDKTWTVWDGTTVLSAVYDDGEYFLYLRGTKNTIITGNNASFGWILHGSNIACIGNIENLLNYTIVASENHPTMADYCYAYMFYGCTALTQAPALPATKLANRCYQYMFQGCTALTQAPSLPATTLADGCYQYMFTGCTALTQAPALPATTMADYCYSYMFSGCTSLTQVPALPTITLANYSCSNMFYKCTSLKLSSAKTDDYTQEYRITYSGSSITVPNILQDMFSSTGGTFTGTPSTNTTYYLSSDNMIVRETDIATLNGYVRSMFNALTIKIGSTTVTYDGGAAKTVEITDGTEMSY